MTSKRKRSDESALRTGVLIATSATGLALSSYGALAAVLWSKDTWYSFFTIGALLFLAPISYRLRRNTLDHTLLEFTRRSPLLFVFLYLVFFALGSLIDLFYGTKLGNLWYYPRYDAEARALHNLIIGYPFAFLSVIPLYEILEFVWLSRVKERNLGQRFQTGTSITLVAISLFLVLLPIFDKYFGSGYWISQLCVVGLVGGIVLVDALRALLQGQSFLQEIISGNYRQLLAILSAAWVAALLHEVPNTFSHTWIYQNIPFTKVQVFGVNVIVLFLGWLFLTIVPVTIFKFIELQSDRQPKPGCLQLERPSQLLHLPYVVFWLLFAILAVLMRFVLLASVHAHDEYKVLTVLMGLGIVWIASEIIWSYRALLRLRKVIGSIATPSRKPRVLKWYKNWLFFIYHSGTMALTGVLVAILFIPMIFVQKALCWTGSGVVCSFDSVFYLVTLFLGGMSQFPFYGMSFLALRLPQQPLGNINLFLSNTGDVRKFGRLFGLVGIGGLGLIIIAEIWLYIAPIKAIWLNVQLVIAALSLGTLPWFLLTQHNIHKLMVRKKTIQLDKVCVELNRSLEAGLDFHDETQLQKIMVLTALKTQIEDLPEWPFSTSALVQLATAAGAAAGLVPLLEFVRK